MPSGTIKRFNNDKGFGFITPAALGATDLFVHQSSLVADRPARMEPDTEVAYTATPGPGGPQGSRRIDREVTASCEARRGGHMALNSMTRSSKRPTPPEQARAFKAAQEQMKQDAALRRLETDKSLTASKRRSRS